MTHIEINLSGEMTPNEADTLKTQVAAFATARKLTGTVITHEEIH